MSSRWESDPRPHAYQACALPLSYWSGTLLRHRAAQWAGRDSNSRRRSQLIYSQPPLATWVPARAKETREYGPETQPHPDPYSLPADSWYGEPTMGLEPATGGLQNRCSAN